MISNLPRDLVEEILSRVPLKFMRSMRLTCKNWNTLSKKQSFSKMQIDKEEVGEYQMIVMMNEKLYLMSVVNNGDPYIEPKGKLISQTEQFKVSQVSHCEGLLLCIFEDDKRNTKLMVWNPYFLQPKWYEPRCSYSRFTGVYHCCYGLGYVEKIKNKSCGRSYKILRFIDYSSYSYTTQEYFYWYEIYDIESESWTTLDITPLRSVYFRDFGITVKGNTYWCVTKGYSNDIHIISFDFTKERFGPLMPLPFNAGVNKESVTLSCVREEKLAALLQHYRPNLHDCEIWITTEIEAEKFTWSKFFTVNMGPEISYALKSFIVGEEKNIVIGYENKINIIEESGYFKELDLFRQSNKYQRLYLCAYVPSLVQIKQGARRKRKKLDYAEKYRFDEKMLGLVAREKLIQKPHRPTPPEHKVGFVRDR